MFMLTDPLLHSGESRAEASVTGPLPAGARTAGDDGSALQIKMLRGARNGWRPFARSRPKDCITSARPFGILRWVGAQAGGRVGRETFFGPEGVRLRCGRERW